MTTDISELAQRMKAAAEKATPGPWYVHDKPCEDGNYGIDTSDKEFLAEAVVWWGFARQSIWREEDAKYIALANPANILALVEALEYYKSREERVTSLVRDNSKSWDELYRQVEAKGKRNVELVEALESEKRICATWRKTAEANSEKLEKAQQQMTESENRVRKQNRHICELFDDNTALRQRIAGLESRTVTVKLPDINEYLAEVHDKTLNRAFRLLAEGVRAGDVAAMRAAGIKVEVD
ncbi:TPA: ead/Ea22-like family protein [Klebsiella pneumoniae]|nr:ead/Ea22-like family protein [Klebsiella pneumoniae]